MTSQAGSKLEASVVLLLSLPAGAGPYPRQRSTARTNKCHQEAQPSSHESILRARITGASEVCSGGSQVTACDLRWVSYSSNPEGCWHWSTLALGLASASSRTHWFPSPSVPVTFVS